MFPTDPSLPPADLRSLLPMQQTPWMVSSTLFKRLQDDPNPAYRKCEILQTDPEWSFILHYFLAQKPANKSIGKAYCIHNGAQHIQFEANLSVIEEQTKNDAFTPQWKREDHDPLRDKVIKRWTQLTAPYSPCTLQNKRKDQIVNTKVIPLWHGTKEAICESICATGFTTFGKHDLLQGKKDKHNSDVGYFGSGLYFTTSANYAASVYSDGNLLLAWVSMREPYPVITDDMEKLKGQHAYKNFNAHYIPVMSFQPDNPNCGIYYPCTDLQDPTLDEIVVFNPSQTLARFWIELQADLLKTPTVITYTHFLDQLMKLLDQESVKEDKDLWNLLDTKSDFVVTLGEHDPLTPADQEFYNWMIKLLDEAGKVKSFAQKKLKQVHGKQDPQLQQQFQETPQNLLQPAADIAVPDSPPPTDGQFYRTIFNFALWGPPILMATAGTPVVPAVAFTAATYYATKKIAELFAGIPQAPDCAFGKAKWTHHFGDVGEEPPLPTDINQILQSPCPIWKGKKIEETHILALIPAKVDSMPLTLKRLEELVQKPKSGPAATYNHINLGQCQDETADHSYWVLMSRDVLDGSHSEDWETQFQQVATLAQTTSIPYTVPKMKEVAICLSIHYVSTGQMLYGQGDAWTYTRCEEFFDIEDKLVVGSFDRSSHISIHRYSKSDWRIGIGVIRRL